LTLIEKGVSDENSVGRMFRFPKSPGMTSFSKSNSFDLQKGKAGSALDVDIPLVRAGDVLKELGVSPTDDSLRLLKIDVEGFELRALKGLDLQKYRFEYLTLEFFPHLLKNAGTNPADLLVYIWSCGYRYFNFDPKSTNDWEQSMNTGANEEDVRAWAEGMMQRGHKERGDDFHTNLFAKLEKR
jgi:FkbM family methyltransferase